MESRVAGDRHKTPSFLPRMPLFQGAARPRFNPLLTRVCAAPLSTAPTVKSRVVSAHNFRLGFLTKIKPDANSSDRFSNIHHNVNRQDSLLI